MKKIFTTLVMAVFAITGYSQQTQQYWRVEFDMPIVNDGSGKTSVASGMKDDYTYCNPEHEYLDFQANGVLTGRGEANPMSFRTTNPSNVSETSYFYLENGRTAQYNESRKEETTKQYPYLVDHITKMTAYSIPVETVELIDSVPFTDYIYPGNNKKYKGTIFTFNRLPRNVAELKTLMDNADGSRCEAANNPLFVAAVFYLVVPRFLDCSQDCRNMMDYLFGVQYPQLSTHGIANATFQNWCIGSSFDQLDGGGFREHNKLFQHFAGATPDNQYKPNGKGYGYDNGPYKVRVVWDSTPTEYSGQMRATIARLLLMANPDARTKEELSFDDPTAHLVKLRSTNKNGWFMIDGEKIYFQKGKDQGWGEDF